MKDFSFKSKILVLVSIGLLGILFATFMTIQNAHKGKVSLNDFIQKAVIPNSKLEKLEQTINWTYANMVEVTSDFAPTVASYDLMKTKFVEVEKQLNNLNNEVFIENKKLINDIKKDWFSMKKVIIEKILPAYEDEDLELVGEITQIDISPYFFSIKKTFKQLNIKVKKYYQEIQENSTKRLDDSSNFSLIISIINIIAVLLIGYYIAVTQFTKPILEFQKGLLLFFDYMNKKTTQITLLDENRKDEFGQMAKVLNENILKIEKNLKIDFELIEDTTQIANNVKSGDLTSRVTKISNNEELNKLKDVLNHMIDSIDTYISKILNVLDSYSNLDYTKKVKDINVEAQLAQLSNGINNLGETISKMLLDSLNNGSKLKENANFLQENVEKVSASTSQEAASLEETAAALEEITETIVSNATNINQMSNYAKELASAVKQGEELAHKTTSSMDKINTEITAINEAITVIDQIAFQTNILSLNAAVEAATAGEAGKGFAVVAGEVRNLAARSAEAASEIKNLVQSATTKANDGKIVSDSMIEGYNNLNRNIQDTIELINNVSISSSEQKTGIEQINDAIGKLDQQTQANASASSQTKEIANLVNKMAENIVTETNHKKFIGKDI
ncbi:MAG: methyl-accepting chemotaxis protein [Halarcobacter sp.]